MKVAIEVEIPEGLYDAIVQYVDCQGLDWSQFASSAFSQRLLQTPQFCNDKSVAKVMLASQFNRGDGDD